MVALRPCYALVDSLLQREDPVRKGWEGVSVGKIKRKREAMRQEDREPRAL